MFFYIDESGHTGANLFDEAQPMLFYGLLSSEVHLDYVAESKLVSLRRKLGVERLHASELGNARLAQIASELTEIQKRFRLRFDLYRVAKPDHAIICFFDQVFDSGMNPAVSWHSYWTPMRYLYLIKVAHLFDLSLAKRAWNARINVNDHFAQTELVAVCRELKSRLHSLPDERSRVLIGDALAWTIANPSAISYNVESKERMLQVTPNLVGFQCVLHGVAERLRTKRCSASRIIVDRQSQFNQAQQTLAGWFARAAGFSMPLGRGMPEVNFNGMPTIPIEFKAGTDSAGLELVDVYLWIFKRWFEGKEISGEFSALVNYQMLRGRTDEVSLASVIERFANFEQELPSFSEMPNEQVQRARAYQAQDDERRRKVLEKLPVLSDPDVQAD